jgi:hypothetical protein
MVESLQKTPTIGFTGNILNDRILANDPLVEVSLFGDENFNSEELLAFELGYRIQPMDRLFVDIAAFYNLYDRLRTIEPQRPLQEISPLPSRLVRPFVAGNKMAGETYGVEWYYRLETLGRVAFADGLQFSADSVTLGRGQRGHDGGRR